MAVIKENTIYIRPLQIDDAEGNLKLQSEICKNQRRLAGSSSAGDSQSC